MAAPATQRPRVKRGSRKEQPDPSRALAHEMSRRLGRGMNLGNCFDVEGDGPSWLHPRHLQIVRTSGFDTVRLPVKWSARAEDTEPYAIHARFLDGVDSIVNRALALGLNVILNVHDYDQLYNAWRAHTERFLALWRQIGRHYARYPSRLYLELLNEPRDPMGPDDWNALLSQTLPVVRESNPGRMVIVGSASMSDAGALPQLELPSDDRLIVTFHYYSPFSFTHQGAPWWAGSEDWVGSTWGSAQDRRAVRADFAAALDWAAENDRPVFLGEFGTYSRADIEMRARWTTAVRRHAERLGISWAYWDFGTDFGAFDLEAGAWRQPLEHALLGNDR
jgi:endoglucanase